MAKKKKTRPISQRDMSLSPPSDVLRRLLFIAYIMTGAAGLVLLVAALARHRPGLAVVGGVGLATSVLLHLTRSRWGAAGVVDELRTNPFKPDRVAKDEDDAEET